MSAQRGFFPKLVRTSHLMSAQRGFFNSGGVGLMCGKKGRVGVFPAH